MRVISILLPMIILVLGCSALANESQKIYGIKVEKDQVSINVLSNGCTSTESFKMHWQNETLTIERIKPDNCRRKTHKKWLNFKIPQNVEQFRVNNLVSR